MDNIGELIRKARKENAMTLKQLAEQTGISVSFLSEVERGTANISIALLSKVAAALKLGPMQFTEGEAQLKKETEETAAAQKPAGEASCDVRVVKKDQRILIKYPGYDGVPELLTPDFSRQMDAMYVKLRPGFESGLDPIVDARGEKFLYMLEGSATMTVYDKIYELQRGDAIYYPASAPMRFQNAPGTTVEVLVVLASPGK